MRVRLVRACGSKLQKCGFPTGYLLVRLVRACGSKLMLLLLLKHRLLGQARKSLWIETLNLHRTTDYIHGQARKSLWIETLTLYIGEAPKLVRLVRACGSKRSWYVWGRVCAQVRLVRACGSKLYPSMMHSMSGNGQARKSLWIETIREIGAIIMDYRSGS